MRMLLIATLTAGLSIAAGSAPAQAPSTPSAGDCLRLLQGMSPEGRQGLQQLMASGQGAGTMDSLMQMAKRLGNGNTLAGLGRIVELVGKTDGLGGILGGALGGQPATKP